MNHMHHSISVSPKGWTDQELGSTWLQRDFEPETATRNTSNGYRLLILDGHNSHCTYRFCKFAEEHRILIICLPSHTTHILQPCDVGVFGPLSSYWKAQVNAASRAYIPITKSNLLSYYHTARENAFRKTTITAAFRKTGIHPLNPDAIDKAVFEPAKNTTTQAAQILPVQLPELLLPISETTTPTPHDEPSTTKAATMLQTTPGIANRYLLVGLPPQLPHSASRQALEAQNEQLRAIANAACIQIQKDYTQMVLMDSENERLRQRAFAKQKKTKRTQTTTHPRHMTSNDVLDALALTDWRAAMKEVHKQAAPTFAARRKLIDNDIKQAQAAEKAQKKSQKEKERIERQDAIAAAKLANRQEKGRLREKKKAETLRKAAARKAAKGKRVTQKRKADEETESESSSEEFINYSSGSSSNSSSADSTPPPPPSQFPRSQHRQHLQRSAPTIPDAARRAGGAPAGAPGSATGLAGKTNAARPRPQPVKRTIISDANDDTTNAPVASTSSTTLPVAESSTPRPVGRVLRRSVLK